MCQGFADSFHLETCSVLFRFDYDDWGRVEKYFFNLFIFLGIVCSFATEKFLCSHRFLQFLVISLKLFWYQMSLEQIFHSRVRRDENCDSPTLHHSSSKKKIFVYQHTRHRTAKAAFVSALRIFSTAHVKIQAAFTTKPTKLKNFWPLQRLTSFFMSSIDLTPDFNRSNIFMTDCWYEKCLSCHFTTFYLPDNVCCRMTSGSPRLFTKFGFMSQAFVNDSSKIRFRLNNRFPDSTTPYFLKLKKNSNEQ